MRDAPSTGGAVVAAGYLSEFVLPWTIGDVRPETTTAPRDTPRLRDRAIAVWCGKTLAALSRTNAGSGAGPADSGDESTMLS